MFGKRLRTARMAHKITQQRMSEMLNISLNAYQKYEQSERSPSLDTLVMIADILSVSIDWLLGRDAFLQSHGVSVDEYL